MNVRLVPIADIAPLIRSRLNDANEQREAVEISKGGHVPFMKREVGIFMPAAPFVSFLSISASDDAL
jgi:hypothetical protein